MADITREKLLFTVAYIDTFVSTLIIPMLAPHIVMNGGSLFTVGTVTSLYLALQLISNPFIRKWSDVRGYQSVLRILLPICAVCYFILGFTTAIPLIFLFRIVLGVCSHTQSLCETRLAKGIQQGELRRRMGLCGALSFLIAPVIGGHSLEIHNGHQYVCCFLTLLCILNLVIVHYYFPQITEEKKKEKKEPSKSTEKEDKNISVVDSALAEIHQSITPLLNVNWMVYWDVVALAFLFDFALSAHMITLAPTVIIAYGAKGRWVGYTFLAHSVVNLLSGFIVELINQSYRDDVQYIRRISHGFSIFTASFICLMFAPNWLSVVFLLVPLSVSASLLRTVTSQVIMQRTSSEKQGSEIGGGRSVILASQLISPICAGLIFYWYRFWGISLLKVTIAGVATALASSTLFVSRVQKKKED